MWELLPYQAADRLVKNRWHASVRCFNTDDLQLRSDDCISRLGSVNSRSPLKQTEASCGQTVGWSALIGCRRPASGCADGSAWQTSVNSRRQLGNVLCASDEIRHWLFSIKLYTTTIVNFAIFLSVIGTLLNLINKAVTRPVFFIRNACSIAYTFQLSLSSYSNWPL